MHFMIFEPTSIQHDPLEHKKVSCEIYQITILILTLFEVTEMKMILDADLVRLFYSHDNLFSIEIEQFGMFHETTLFEFSRHFSEA